MTLSINEISAMIPPSPWVAAHLPALPKCGRMLDLACGRGRHSRLLAQYFAAEIARGFISIQAVDRDRLALAELAGLAGVETRALDLEEVEWPLAGEHFAAVVVTNYLWRPHLAAIMALLAPGGVLIYETFMLGNEAFGKPSNPDFLLRPGELREGVAAAGLRELAFSEGYVDVPKPALRQAICAIRD